ncbi:MAG: FAD-dependent oxidoreductase, partial [Phycisphaeraceae bacterium]|nr:FAD-dependent oxidoreductase [Phycisphaeraceae bacterium]
MAEAPQPVELSVSATGALERDLRAAIDGDVDFSRAGQTLYATDASHYRQVPIGVVFPRHADDVIAAMTVCRRHEVPVLSRGGGTSLAGQGCNVAVVLDHSRYFNRILEIDPDRRIARVQPGCVLDTLRDAAEAHGLTFGPDPSTHAWCTLGGMIGNNACGVHSVMAGKTVDNVHRLKVVCYDGTELDVGPTEPSALEEKIAGGGRKGEIYAGLKSLRDQHANQIRESFPDIPRRVSGINLDQLLPENDFQLARALVGTEGTCATILEATVRLVP